MSEKTYKVGIIGAGVMGDRMIQAIANHSRCQVAAISDVSEERAKEAAKQAGDAA